jgi:hypothetical protein
MGEKILMTVMDVSSVVVAAILLHGVIHIVLVTLAVALLPVFSPELPMEVCSVHSVFLGICPHTLVALVIIHPVPESKRGKHEDEDSTRGEGTAAYSTLICPHFGWHLRFLVSIARICCRSCGFSVNLLQLLS